MRICFATGEKQPIVNPTVKLLFLHSGCCFEVVGTALFTLYTPHLTLHTLHIFTLYTPHFTLYTPHFTLYTLHSTLYTPHFTVYTQHSTLHSFHSTLHAPHSTLYTLHSTLYTFTLYTLNVQDCVNRLFQKSVLHDCISMCFDIITSNIRVSIRVRGLHLV